MISARVDLVRGWGEQMARQMERQAREALKPASEAGAQVASHSAASRRRTGKMAQMDVLPTVSTPRGYSAGFRSRAWYADFQSSGTSGRRSRKVKASTLRRRESLSGQSRAASYGSNPGITPLKFLEKGRSAARKELVARLKRIG